MPISEATIAKKLRIGPRTKVLDIGGAAKQYQQIKIDTLVDLLHPETVPYTPSKLTAKNFIQLDLTRDRLPFKAKSFDVCLCAHTLEDLDTPFLAIEEMSRVAKRGLIITPSRGQDSTFRHYDLTDWGVGGIRQPGLAHHQWLFEKHRQELIITPKNYPLLYAQEFQIVAWSGPQEMVHYWDKAINYQAFDSISHHDLIDNYRHFMAKNQRHIRRGRVAFFWDHPKFIVRESIKRLLRRGMAFSHHQRFDSQ